MNFGNGKYFGKSGRYFMSSDTGSHHCKRMRKRFETAHSNAMSSALLAVVLC